jgi:hypothetical protein
VVEVQARQHIVAALDLIGELLVDVRVLERAIAAL